MLVNGRRQTLRLTDNAGMYSNSRARHIYTANNSWTGWYQLRGNQKRARLWHLWQQKMTNSMH